ncbi:uncharacterized protein [Ptychodera flava]|uniref:uncharacterized protein isoform X2 n=1 Tax=Ptychodera flava TaxID=63121 RepID=UPI00396A3AC3
MNILEESMVFQGPVENTTAFGVMLPNQRQLCHQKRPNIAERTLDDLNKCHAECVAVGSKRSQAADFKNCIQKPYFNIPLDRAENIRVLFNAISRTTEQICPELVQDAESIRARYQPLLLLFGACHNIYSVSRVLTDEEILHFVDDVKALMVYYRRHFPTESVFPKLHILEDHVPQRIKLTKRGLGFYGESGLEAIHHSFNVAAVNYANMPDALNRMKCLVNDHHVKTRL